MIDKNGNFKQLSRDHKAWATEEHSRIIDNGGFISENYRNYIYSPKVYVSEEDTVGLKVTRSIGDLNAK